MNAKKMYLMELTVSGLGSFPYDMLRYDHCWPVTGTDAAAIQPHQSATQAREVVLRTYQVNKDWRPTVDRWQSFGWRVLSCGRVL